VIRERVYLGHDNTFVVGAVTRATPTSPAVAMDLTNVARVVLRLYRGEDLIVSVDSTANPGTVSWVSATGAITFDLGPHLLSEGVEGGTYRATIHLVDGTEDSTVLAGLGPDDPHLEVAVLEYPAP
jgi:hypothetical protein